MRGLRAHRTGAHGVALRERVLADRRELTDCRVGTVGEVGVAVPELGGEVELQALCDRDRPSGRRRVDAREPLDHLPRRAQHRLAVPTPLALAPVERGPAADRDERVLEERPSRGVRVDVSRRDGLDPEVLGQVAERGVPPGVAPLVRSLELDEEPLPPERGCEPGRACRVAEREPVARAAGEADEALVELGDRRERHGGLEQDAVLLPLGSRARMRGGEDPAQVRVAPARLDEERQVSSSVGLRRCHLGPRDRPDAGVLRRVGELERAVDAVVIGQRERGVAELCGPHDELLGMRRAVEERVGGMAVQLDIRGGTRGSPTCPLLHGCSPHTVRRASRPAEPASGHERCGTNAVRPAARLER